ncbi:LysR family transcriptional regulator [Patulibacter sp.]|uniref:LysR family transcriptional regulator n=1 Tax=Patulibacter sp. TaxID=1912859 RepID=UPI002719128E|nr:LysR family transcriptional regulator [Patulibacter sp.]MDO9407913.1 LysR family transcriptional regulator [Patulibacter sp.]
MNLRQLEYLSALAREGHFGRAAAACHVSQPALSTGIARLEEELGLELVRRGGRTAALTDEGRAVLPWAQGAVAAGASVTAEAARLRGELQGALRLGVIPTAATAAAVVTAPLLEAHPGVRARVRTTSGDRILAALRSHELDAGLVYVDEEPAGVAVTRLYRERLVLVTGSGRIAPGVREVPWTRVTEEPLCLLTSEMQHRRVVDDALEHAGAVAAPRVEADGFGILLDFVAAGWSTVLSRSWLAGRLLPDGVRVIPLVRPAVAPWVGLVTAGGPAVPPLVAALRASLRGVDVAERLGGAAR